MAIAQVQDNQAASTAGATTVAVTISAATAGNLLIACCSYRADRTLTVPTGFTAVIDGQNTNSNTTHQDVNISYKIAAGGETSFTFTISGTGNLAGWVGEYSPVSGQVWQVSPVDQTGAKVEGDTTLNRTSTSFTTGTADEVIIVCFGWNDSGSGLPTSRGYTNSFTEQGFANTGTNNAVAAIHRIVTATLTTNTVGSWTNTANATLVSASFKGVTATNNYTPSVSDSIALADARTMDRGVLLTAPVALTDSAATAKTIPKSLTDTLTLADATARVKTIPKSLTDSVVLADSASTAKVIAKALADTLTLADLLSSAKVKSVAISDSLVLTDALSRVVAYARSQPDAVALLDEVLKARGVSLADTLALADSFTRVRGQFMTLADIVLLTDTIHPRTLMDAIYTGRLGETYTGDVAATSQGDISDTVAGLVEEDE